MPMTTGESNRAFVRTLRNALAKAEKSEIVFLGAEDDESRVAVIYNPDPHPVTKEGVLTAGILIASTDQALIERFLSRFQKPSSGA